MAVGNSLAQRKTGIATYLTSDAVKNNINKVIGGANGDRFIASIVSAVQTNPALQECSNPSIVSGALLGESLKLSPSPQLGQYYLVPFKNSKTGTTEATFQLGYKGMIMLAQRSGQYKRLNALAIKEGELISYDALNEEIEVQLIEDEVAREKAKTIGYYATYELLNGFKKSLYWSREKMEAHAMRYSMGYRAKKGYTFWEKDFDGMAIKTMYRRLLSTAPMSIDMQTAFTADMGVVRDNGAIDYVDSAEEMPIPPSTIAVETVSEVEVVNVSPEPKKAPKKVAESNNEVDTESALFN